VKRKKVRVNLRNLQRRVKVDGRSFGAFLKTMAADAGRDGDFATFVLVSDEKMQALNRNFRGFDRTTDVLSFPAGDSTPPGEEPYLGDVVISVETARRQALRRGSTLPRELRVLALHGYLHLRGYDHDTDDGEMRRIEYRLRQKLGITRPRKIDNAATKRKARKK
jgi:probable rRNA maturation factor